NCSAKNRRKNNKTAAALCVQQPFARCSASGKKASRENPQISRLENIKYFSAWFTGRYPHRPSQ
ncbi:MAG: hypothetical protein UEK48_07835, partial [Faecalibacterium prausnitzii]|nr:hypothetical protein [Faecalibacterium prausnitzii]